MAEVLANLTQVINNSPQVSSLVGGQMAATEDARRLAQLEESQRQQDVLRSTVLAVEESSKVGRVDPDGRQRLETKRERQRRRAQAEREARAKRAAKAAEDSPGCGASSDELKPVIDVCV